MAFEWLLDPVSDDLPCGPDLEKTDDPDFLDYYFEAESRLPERYFTPGAPNVPGGGEDRLFDPRSVDLRGETQAITNLLRRSRDLRLLGLLARFQILAGRVGDFAATLEAMAGLLASRLEEVHPQTADSPSDRRGALDALAEQPTVVMPLIHLPLLGNSNVTFRQYQVSTGAVPPRLSEAENIPEPGALVSALRNPANLRQVTAIHAELTRAAQALQRIADSCRANGAFAFTPDFGPTFEVISDIQHLIGEALPDLPHWTAEPAAPVEPATPETADPAPETAQPPVPVSARSRLVPDHRTARTVIQAAEAYLARNEPSSLSLLLVVQARLLVGKSIVEAIELLMPQDAPRVELTLGKGRDFAIDMDRLRMLSQSLAPQAGDSSGDSADAAEAKPVVIESREQLAGYLQGVEEFYLRNEPASPIPVLLSEARNMLTRTFHAILNEILPPKPIQG